MRMWSVSAALNSGSPTAWSPQSKPIWITETGCPAVDRGANAPNIFPDPKSSESGLPYFSAGVRDDFMQARAMEAVLSHFDPALEGYAEGANPVSTVYGGRWWTPQHLHRLGVGRAAISGRFRRWRAVWSDAADWETGHWLTGRLEERPDLDQAARSNRRGTRIASASPSAKTRISMVRSTDTRWTRRMSVRDAIDPLAACSASICRSAASVIGAAFSVRSSPSDLSCPTTISCPPRRTARAIQLTRGQEI